MTKNPYIQLHIAVLLFGFTAILGDLIQLQETVLVWWRLFFTVFSLLFFVSILREIKSMPKVNLLPLMGIGVLVATHWVLFYGSIKYSNASICLICMATTSFFTAILEPLILKERFKWYEVLLGLMIIPGMALIVTQTTMEQHFGIVLGILSAVLAAIFSILNKKMLNEDKASILTMTFVELGSGLVFLTLIMPIYISFFGTMKLYPDTVSDLLYLLVLALGCTTFAYVLAFKALRHLSAFTANLTVALEPVYGILLALFLLNDHKELNPNFYLGVLIILFAVFSYPFIKKRMEKTIID